MRTPTGSRERDISDDGALAADRQERRLRGGPPLRPPARTGGRLGLRWPVSAGKGVGGSGGVEAEPGFGSVAEAEGPELLGVLVDPGAGEAELPRELLGVDELRPSRRRVWFAQELSDTLGDRFDGLRRELLDCGTKAASTPREGSARGGVHPVGERVV